LHLIATEPPAVSLNALLKEHPVVKALVDVLEDTKKYGLRNPPNSWYIARDKALAALDNLK